ncbi:JAB domain-containing protein [Rufibacter ruber]|uniref:JAB domain-containing protein n=1 Tax=Rufibacter ruber TaxID=1783499 RepID=UPI0008318172|nr:JAB domain-containing protein [Rufibacter ruber]
MKKRVFKLSEVDITAVGEVELTYRRHHTEEAPILRNVKVTCSDDINKFLRKRMEKHIEHTEGFYALYLNRNNYVLGVYCVSMGGVAGTVADPKIILQAGLLLNASAVVISHNHPSGNLKPSGADAALTRKLQEACKLVDIALLDHIIITPESYYSFADDCEL